MSLLSFRTFSTVLFLVPGLVSPALFGMLYFSQSFLLDFFGTTLEEISALGRSSALASQFTAVVRFEHSFGAMAGLFFLAVALSVPAEKRGPLCIFASLGYALVGGAAYMAHPNTDVWDVPIQGPLEKPLPLCTSSTGRFAWPSSSPAC